jgi:hypothetical protein
MSRQSEAYDSRTLFQQMRIMYLCTYVGGSQLQVAPFFVGTCNLQETVWSSKNWPEL